ncbi:hypothetical protein H5410_005597 [Solanum commersonii]|uniref:CO dehydrogenase flavoprotein C-terminal domain-containing protein n=1 Tax=Solanum commersonii TaxID=4109 RepID=A0A9J6A7W4_SOLCO|nr:hypothetical protein H5410_005597 [Solanum commersonii]
MLRNPQKVLYMYHLHPLHLTIHQADVSFCQNGFLINYMRLAFGAYGTKHAARAKMIEGYLTGKMLNAHVLYGALKLVKLAVVLEDGTLHPEYKSSLAVSYVFEFLYPFTEAHSALSGGLLQKHRMQLARPSSRDSP